MSGKGYYDHPAWCKMETELDSYERGRDAYLNSEAAKLGPNGKRQLCRFTTAADLLVNGVQDLASIDAISCLADLAKSTDFQQGKSFKLLDEHICIAFGWEVMGMLSTARARFIDLLLLLKNRQPCNHAKAFLQRVARCYLFGFDAECVVMCRAVIDLEFKAEILEKDVKNWWAWYKTTDEGQKNTAKKAPDNLWGRIQTAKFKKRLATKEEFDSAEAVRNRGNDAVHKTPDSGEALKVVWQTVQVLDALASMQR